MRRIINAMAFSLRPSPLSEVPFPEPLGKYQPLFYDVVGLPPNRMIMICRRMVPIEPACWEILPTTLWDDGDKGVRGQPTGAYPMSHRRRRWRRSMTPSSRTRTTGSIFASRTVSELINGA